MQTQFDIEPLDAAEIARFTAEARAAQIEMQLCLRANKDAVAKLEAVYARVREKNGLPEGANFGWDDSGLKGSYKGD